VRYALELGAGGWAWAAAAAVAAAFAWHAASSRAGKALLALRGFAAFCLCAALLEPSIAARVPLLHKPKLAIMVDASHSMSGSAGGGRTRLEAAAAWLAKNRKAIEARADVSLFVVGARGRRVADWSELSSARPGDATLRLDDAVRDVADDPSGGSSQRAWLLSDGNAEPVPDIGLALAPLKAPLDALGVGPLRRGKGLVFTDLKTPDFAFLHGRFQVEAALEAAGLAGQTLRLRLLKEEPGGGWVVSGEKTHRALTDEDAVVSTFTAQASSLGAERYRLEAIAGGLTRSREFRVEVIRQKYRIMYLAGRPSAEYAYLRDFLRSDPNHELVSFVILRNPENPAFVPDTEMSLIPFPADEIFVQNLSQFDLFILENFSYARFRLPLAYLSSLKSFVAGGGALLVVGGENAFGLGGYRGTPLEDMLPVTLSSFSPDFVPGLFKAKPAAETHPLVRLYPTPDETKAAWEALPVMDGYAKFGSVRPGATVLAVHPSEKTAAGQPLPVLALREHGRGKVLLVSSDSTWRWKLGAAQDWRVGSFYARFWTRAVQYLTGSLDLSKVKFAPLPDRLPAREPAQFSLRVFDESFKPAEKAAVALTVVWTGPDGRGREAAARETEPGVYAVELTGLAVGTHKLRASARYRGKPWGEDEIRFGWEGQPSEQPVDQRWLRRAAEAAGGTSQALGSADVSSLLDRLPPVREQASVSRRYHPWASALWLWLTALAFLAEWTIRRWRGHA
jgi:uncharacterized membrane protein